VLSDLDLKKLKLSNKINRMKLVFTAICFLSSAVFVADAKCNESPPSPPTNLMATPAADTFRIDATQYCESSGTRIEKTNQGEPYVGFLDPNDWMAFDVELPMAGTYQVTYSVASMSGKGAFQLEQLGGSTVYGTVSALPTTGSWYSFKTVSHTVQLPQGKQALALAIRQGEFNLDYIELKKISSDAPDNNIPHSACRADEYVQINVSRTNRISAVDYCDARGAQRKTSQNGGYHVGRIDANDFVAYNIEVPKSDLYRITYRVASKDGSGGLVVEVYEQSSLKTVSNQVNVPSTGSWQKWAIVSHTVYLSQGKNMLVVRGKGRGWNFKSMDIGLGAVSPSPPAANPVPVSPPITFPVPAPVPAPLSTPVRAPVSSTPSKGFVRADGERIVDGNGNNLILRGQGLGGWMLQEPYQMLTVEAAPKGQWQMFQKIEQTVGTAGLEQYHRAWLDNWCTYEDVEELKASGFNSIRVALHYNLFTLPIEEEPVRGRDTWIQDGFDRLDLLLEWCQREKIYLILDLHAAPGGQGRNSAINDYDDSKPSMWEDEENVRKSIALWAKWAARYKDNTWIAGYDLLNEPNWGFEPGHPNGCSEQTNKPLKNFYDRAIEAIRKVDKNHIIYINGNCWGNNHKGMWPFADTNIALSLHRYWIENTDASIQEFLEMREKYNVPLWMGESGENDNNWYKDAVQLLERHNIGWVSTAIAFVK
jgi:aryl-phospho-beta-D-glucosidase BglC (GH1 family)